MLPKLIIAGLLLAIVVSLFSGLFFLMKDTSQSKRTMRALMLRVSLSVALIAFLLLASAMGWIHPHGLNR
ncbi:MAG: twin transmembrane helix small protein [Nevskia sp.]